MCTNVTKIPILFRTILSLFLKKSDNSIESSKEYLLSYLSENIKWNTQNAIQLKFALFVITVLSIFTLGTFITIPCFYFGNKNKYLDGIRKQWIFCLESFIFIITTIFLIIGITFYWNIAIYINKALREYPLEMRLMISDISRNIQQFEVQVQILNEKTKCLHNSIIEDIHDLPYKLRNSVISNVDQDINLTLSSVNQSLDLMHSYIFDNHTDISTYDFHNFIENIHQNSSGWIRNTKDKKVDDFLHIILDISKKLTHLQSDIYNKNEFVNFLNSSKTELLKVVNTIETKKLDLNLTMNFTNTMKIIDHTLGKLYCRLRKFEEFVDPLFVISIPRVFSLNINVYWIIMLPVIYSILYIILVLSGCLCGLKDLRKISIKSDYHSEYTCLKLLKISIIVSSSFLWIIFLLCIMLYLIFYPFSAICKAMKDQTIFTRYIDNTTVWNGTTWVSNAIENSPILNTTKLQNVLDLCYENKTIYSILNLEQMPTENYYASTLDVNKTCLLNSFREDLKQVTTTNSNDFDRIIKGLGLIEKNLLLPQIVLKNGETIEDLKNILGNDFGNFQLKFLINEIQNKMNVGKIFYNNVLRFYASYKLEIIENAIEESLEEINLKYWNLTNYINYTMENDLGNCYVLPSTFSQAKCMFCDHLLLVSVGAFISLTIMAYSMLISIILTLRLLKYLKGSIDYYKHVNEVNGRYSTETSRMISMKQISTNSLNKNSSNIIL